MDTRRHTLPIPVVQAPTDPAADACAGAESFALMVIGDSMEPEFAEGEIIIVEPEGLARDGSYVLAFCGDEWVFRQLVGCDGDWQLRPLNPGYPTLGIPDLSAIRGVVIQKAKPGRRRATKHYV